MLPVYGQQDSLYNPIPDSVRQINLSDIIVVGKPLVNHLKQPKPLSSLDEYLEHSSLVGMVKRGNYAWEPMVNNMASERLAVTIDGMHIFGACTDKMDPITSYVDVSNLSEINVYSGQNGSANGPTIGGAVDLNRSRADYTRTGWSGGMDVGFESNALLQTYGAEVNYTHRSFFIDADAMYRDAQNYKAGDNEEVPFSQYTKYNIAAMAGGTWKGKNIMEVSLIFDKANDVGYPALPMDVSLARAIISSLRYERTDLSPGIQTWETRAYYNSITHRMDDTQRPDVPIHMDMPGWSKTYGGYSKMKGSVNKHDWKTNLTIYFNQSLAEMTMYPEDPEESLMFMYTWPDVRTQYAGLFAEDAIRWGNGHSTRFSASAGFHRNAIADEFGLNSLRIFYPDMEAHKGRILSSLTAAYTFKRQGWELSTGTAWGDRAPSVSEGYGFYLFNSFDSYDYVGNPGLQNERSVELNAAATYRNDKLKTTVTTAYFHLFNYIIGIPDPSLLPMTIGASGVKIYDALDGVNMFNTEWSADYRFHEGWRAKAAIQYSVGRDNNGSPIPLIRPFSFRTGLAYSIKSFDTEITAEGAAKQGQYSSYFGEDETPAYAVLGFSAGYTFFIENNRLILKLGAENILDTRYSTFSDWNNILRKGRNFFINLSFVLDKKAYAE